MACLAAAAEPHLRPLYTELRRWQEIKARAQTREEEEECDVHIRRIFNLMVEKFIEIFL
jgi:uncharacterized Rmd1/YagE family protein